MSRIGNKVIHVPASVTVLGNDNLLRKGPIQIEETFAAIDIKARSRLKSRPITICLQENPWYN